MLAAARDLLTDRGLPGLSVDEIATHAGVSKNTIYRWWPTKAAVLMDAFTDAFADRMSVPAEGDALTRLRTTVRRVATLMSDPDARRPFVALVAAAQHDPELAAALRDRFIAGRRAEVGELLAEARSAGGFPTGFDPDTAIDLIYGALYYRLLISGETLDSGYADRILTAMGLFPD